MKKFTSLLIGCSLALAGAAMAQQPDEQQSPSKNKKQGQEKKTHAAEAKPGANAAKPEGAAAKQHGARNERGAGKGQKGRASQESATAPATGTDVSGQPAGSATPAAKQQAEHGRKGMKGHGANAKTSASPAAAAAGGASASPAAASASAAPAVSSAGQQRRQANAGAAAKKPDPQKVQQIKQQHANFRAQAKPQQVPAVTFNESYRIQGSDRWQGPQYEVFRSYHPERHDQGWYRSHYGRVELIGGGYYYFNNGYWYPAWGYSPSEEYYAYDAPIYVGHRAEPPDRVIADVQATLQDMGYYKGEVDGLLGPLTREALTAYQADQGLTATAVIDQPTLDSLGMG
jgi:Putative peptidoglycan binding domain